VSQLTVAPGARVSAFGRVVSAAGAVWFEPPPAVPLIRYLPGREPAPRPSGLGVAVRGADLTGLLDLREKDGALEGWATITGIWQDDKLTVTAQCTLRPPPTPHPPSWTVPPCQPPAGGWPSGSDVPAGFDDGLAALRASGGAVHITMFSPVGGGQVPVVCASNPELAESRLRPVCGQRLCVVPSRYSQAQVDAVRADIHRHFQDWQVYFCGLTSGEHGQILMTLSLVRLTPDIAAWAEKVPAGLLAVDPWLVPLPARDPRAAEPAAPSRRSASGQARRWLRLLGAVLALGLLAAAVLPIATGRLSSAPLQAQREARTACTLLGQGVARRDPTTRTAAADLAATAATKDRRWLPLSQQLAVDAAQATTSGSQSSCSSALSRVTWSPRLHLGTCALVLALVCLPASLATRRRLVVSAPLVLFGAGVVLIAGAI